MLFRILIFLMVIAGFIGDSFSIREYKLPRLETGAKISLLLVAYSLILINQKFYNAVNIKISNQVADNFLIVFSLEKITIGENELDFPNSLKNNGETSKFRIFSEGEHEYLLIYTVTSNNFITKEESIIRKETSGTIDIESNDIFDIKKDSKSNDLKLVER